MSETRWKKFISNFDQNSAFFSLLLALMSFCAIVVSMLTLKEMQTQRDLSMMPIIYPQNFQSLKIKSDSICDQSVFHYNISGIVKEGDSLVEKKINDWFKLGFINVGKGSAVNIEFTWDLNFEFYANFFDTLELDPKIIKFTKENVKDKFYNMHFYNCKTGTSTIYEDKYSISYTHLLPASDTNEDFHLSIPSQVLAFHIAQFKSSWLKHGQNNNNTHTFSLNHYLTLKYESVNGKEFKSKYEVEVEIYLPNVFYKQTRIYAPWENFVLGVYLKKI